MAHVKKSAKKPAAKAKKPAAKKKVTPAKKIAVNKTPLKAKPVKKNSAKSKPAKKAVAVKETSARVKRASGLPEQLRDAALKVLDERQADDIMTFDLEGRSTIADYLIIASGRAARQLAAIAQHLGEAFAKLGVARTKVEGLPEANWVLIDAGDVIIHLFLPEVRGFYNLEGIWNKRGA